MKIDKMGYNRFNQHDLVYIQDKDGDQAVHHAAFGDEPGVMEVFILWQWKTWISLCICGDDLVSYEQLMLVYVGHYQQLS